jgi:hypothetical protein
MKALIIYYLLGSNLFLADEWKEIFRGAPVADEDDDDDDGGGDGGGCIREETERVDEDDLGGT